MAPLIHTFTTMGKHYVFDANANTILPISEQQWPLVQAIENGDIQEESQSLLDTYREQGYFHEPNIQKIEHPETSAMKYHLSRKIQKLTLQVTQACNLRCSYCTYSGMYKNRQHELKSMSFETAKKAIDYVLANSIDTKDISFGFYGGEPLLEMELIEECIKYVRENCIDKDISFTITTNGTLLTCANYEWLTNNGVDILISLDGPKEIHDSARKYADGKGSFDDIIKNVFDIQSKFPDAKDKLRFMAVANPEIQDSCIPQLYTMDEIFPEYNVNLNFINDLYAEAPIGYSEEFNATIRQERAKLFLYMLGKLDRSRVSRLVIEAEDDIVSKYKLLKRIKGLPQICHPGGPCLAGVHRLFVNVDGVFYPCERVSETSNMMKIGNVDSGICVEKANTINNVGKTTAEECIKCWAILHCSMCAAFSDDLSEFSTKKRLAQCASSKFQVVESFKDICFLRANGYIFEST